MSEAELTTVSRRTVLTFEMEGTAGIVKLGPLRCETLASEGLRERVCRSAALTSESEGTEGKLED